MEATQKRGCNSTYVLASEQVNCKRKKLETHVVSTSRSSRVAASVRIAAERAREIEVVLSACHIRRGRRTLLLCYHCFSGKGSDSLTEPARRTNCCWL